MDMAEVLSLWWVYPAALCIAALAISTGISGALFFVPFFLLVVGVSPAQAIGGGLMTMIFGTGSGTPSAMCGRVWSTSPSSNRCCW